MKLVKHHVRTLHSLGPASNDHLVALRVAASVAVPSLALLFLGRPDLIIYAVFGALTGMYGRNEPHQLRLKHQTQAALFLLSGVTVGVLLSVAHIHSWGLVLVEALLAGVGSVVADRLRLQPNGPFFGILALGACASIPTTIPMLAAVLICAASAAFSIAVGFGGWIRQRAWNRAAVRAAVPLGKQKTVVHAARYVLAVGAAGAIGVLSGSGHPHWAMAAAAVPLAGADLPSSVHRGLHRIVGTFLGLAIVAVVLFPNPISPLQFFPGWEAAVLAVLVIIFQFTTELFMTRHYGLAMVSFTPVILLMTQLAFPEDPLLLVTERGAETLVGAAIGILVVVAIRARRAAADPGRGESHDRQDFTAAS